jgi:hypothetical protein
VSCFGAGTCTTLAFMKVLPVRFDVIAVPGSRCVGALCTGVWFLICCAAALLPCFDLHVSCEASELSWVQQAPGKGITRCPWPCGHCFFFLMAA